MMPQTVPNRPTKGPAEPTVASTRSRRSSRSISLEIETFMTFSIRICSPAKDRAWLSNDRFHSRIAATKQAAIDCVGLAESARYRSSIDCPDQNACSNRSIARLVRAYRNILSIAIAHTQTEQASSPSMTDLTTQCACRNRAISDTSDDTSGKADCDTSAGFISRNLSTQAFQILGSTWLPVSIAAPTARGQALALKPCSVAWEARPKPRPASPANMSKRGLSARLYAPNQTLIMVNRRLPSGLDCGKLRTDDRIRGPSPNLSGQPAPAQAGTGSGQWVRRAGTPTAVQPPGTSRVTTDPAPILAKSPMLTSPRIVAPVLSRTPLPILGARSGASTFRPMVT